MSLIHNILRGYMQNMRDAMYTVLSLNSMYSELSMDHLPGNVVYNILRRNSDATKGITWRGTMGIEQHLAVHEYIIMWEMFRNFLHEAVQDPSSNQDRRDLYVLMLQSESTFWNAMAGLYYNRFKMQKYKVEDPDINNVVLYKNGEDFDRLLGKFPALPQELTALFAHVRVANQTALDVLHAIEAAGGSG